MIDLRKNKPVSILIAVTLLASVLAVSALSARRHEPQKTVQTAATPSQAITPAAAPDDMRGVWITYMELSMENEADKSEAGPLASIRSSCRCVRSATRSIRPSSTLPRTF